MAITLKKQVGVKAPLALKNSSQAVTKKFIIPTELSEPLADLGAYSWLIYGQKKIGKSTLASQFPDSIFFMFEPGAKALRIHRLDCHTWEDALGYLLALEEQKKNGTLKFKTIVLDTGFELQLKCQKYILSGLNIDYPRMDNFGKDWNAIKIEMIKFHDRIFALGLGIVVLCHESVKEQQTFTGNKYDQVVPLLPKSSDDYYRAVIDNVCWYHYRGNDRFLQIKGSDAAMAGVALSAESFFKTSTGEPIYAIPIPSDPKQGYNAIEQAFKNKQSQTFKEATEKLSAAIVKESVNEKLRKASKRANQ